MINVIDNKSQLKAARVSGFMYLLTILTAILSMILVDSKLTAKGNTADIVNSIISNEFLFRISVAYELFLFTSVVILSVALYVTVRKINKNLALLALCWRMGESIIGGVTALSGLAVLLLLNGNYSKVFEPQQFQALVKLFLDIRSTSYLILYAFMGFGSIIFFYLMFKSRYVPRSLAGYGILSYVLMLFWPFINILVPNYPAILETIIIAPGALFEITIGFWLLFKGINLNQEDNRALDAS